MSKTKLTFMKKFTILGCFSVLVLLGCQKSTSNHSTLQPTCYKGKFIREGCIGSQIVQFLSPQESQYADGFLGDPTTGQFIADYVFSTQIDSMYRDGEPFYFTIDTIGTSQFVETQMCVYSMKYRAIIKAISKTSCEPIGD